MHSEFRTWPRTAYAVRMLFGNALRWALLLVVAGTLSSAASGALAAIVDRPNTWPTPVYVGDPDHGQLVPDAGQLGR